MIMTMRKSYMTPQHLTNRRKSDSSSVGGSTRGSGGGYRFSIGRPSLLDSVRRSSIAEPRRDRSHYDKNSHLKSFQSLMAFLNANNYIVPTTSIRLQSAGSTKDVTNILQFLIKFVIPEFPMIKKFDDEFPVILKMLKYPYTINKRQLQPVGSVHNWPIIVHGLYWISSLAKYHLALEETPFVVIPAFSDEVGQFAALKMNLESYNLFLKGATEEQIKNKNEEFMSNELENIVGLNECEAGVLADLEMKLLTHQQELINETEREKVLDKQLLNTMDDKKKLETYIEESKIFAENLKLAIKNSEDKSVESQKIVEELQQKLKEKQMVLSNQKITVHDIQQRKVQICHLQTQIASNRASLDDACKKQGELDLDLLNKLEKIKNEIEDYHRLASSCKIIPSTAENAQGYDYSIHLTNPESETSQSNVDVLNGRLKLILKQWKEANREAISEKMRLMGDVSDMQNISTSKKNEIIELKSKILRLEELYASKEQELKKTTQSLITELSDLEDRIAQAKTASQCTNVEELESKVQELRSTYKNMTDAFRKREGELSECLLYMAEQYIKFKKCVESNLEKVSKGIVEYVEVKREKMETKYEANQKAIDELKEKTLHLIEAGEKVTAELNKLL